MQIMRMNLYEAEIISASGKHVTAVVAPSSIRASEFVRDHYRQTGERLTKIAIRRIDEELEGHNRLRLDDLLETAPVGFAIYLPPVGWLVDHASVTPFHLFKIAEKDGPDTFVIAPNSDLASAVWGASIMPLEGQTRLFRILDGTIDLTERQRELLADLLEFGPAGIVEFDEDRGWLIR